MIYKSENTEKAFLDDFEKQERQKLINSATYDDILYGVELYEELFTLTDEIAQSILQIFGRLQRDLS